MASQDARVRSHLRSCIEAWRAEGSSHPHPLALSSLRLEFFQGDLLGIKEEVNKIQNHRTNEFPKPFSLPNRIKTQRQKAPMYQSKFTGLTEVH